MSKSIAALCGLDVDDLTEEEVSDMLGLPSYAPSAAKTKAESEREETDIMMAEIRKRLSSTAATLPQDEMATMIAAFGKEMSVGMGEIGE